MMSQPIQLAIGSSSGATIAPPLEDASGLPVRRLESSDRPAIAEHLLALGMADRHSRFHAYLGDEGIARYVRRIDFGRMILAGAVDGLDGGLIGLAEAHLDDPVTPRAAEVSVSVLEAWRGRGIGRRSVAQAVAAAWERGAERADFFFRPGNGALTRLVTALGGRIDAARGYASLRRPLPLVA